MRDIRFRAWDSVNKLMVDRYEDFWLGHEGRIYIESEKQYDTPNQEISQHSGKGIILMQFTGLKDKNGKEIWEGDILRWRYDHLQDWEIYQIKWGENDYPAFDAYPNENWEHNALQYIAAVEGECEVLGNIYENPELLK